MKLKTKAKILLLEKNTNHAELIKEVLAGLTAVQVVAAFSQKDCFALLKTSHFQLILLDEEFCGKTRLLKFLHRLKDKRENPVFILSAEGDENQAAVAIKAGAEDYFVKNRQSLERLPQAIELFLKKEDVLQKTPKKSLFFWASQEIDQLMQALHSVSQHLNCKELQQMLAVDFKSKIPDLQQQASQLKKSICQLLSRKRKT